MFYTVLVNSEDNKLETQIARDTKTNKNIFPFLPAFFVFFFAYINTHKAMKFHGNIFKIIVASVGVRVCIYYLRMNDIAVA